MSSGAPASDRDCQTLEEFAVLRRACLDFVKSTELR
jgi:hypothetical protein